MESVEAIVEELENICSGNDYVLELLAGIKNLLPAQSEEPSAGECDCHNRNEGETHYCPVCGTVECGVKEPVVTPQTELLCVKKQAIALEILRRLERDLLPEWHSECNCYSVDAMKKTEYEIDAFLDSLESNPSEEK